ncbi:MAG: hypothetical protein EOO01_16265 [Chitinophagaceae bacterium]|nr:MAG: hypothetical protein EOO01_16265 [Chitinophagaceae bacterium]
MYNNQNDKGQQQSGPSLPLVIEGKPFTWPHQYITDAELRQLGHLPAEGDIYMDISEPWRDEKIDPSIPVNLAREGIEQFYIRRPLPYTINGKEFTSNSQYIKGQRIRQEGNISKDDDIFLQIEKPWDDELIENHEWVNLARPGREHFCSKPSIIDITLIVNAREKMWNKRTITFEEVVFLQYGPTDPNPQITYSVLYKNGPRQNPEGMMTEGETLFVKDKMNFHVSKTNQS